jgi:hypothetical protein
MNEFEIVTIGVTVVAVMLAATPFFRPSLVLAQLGRQGQMWFDHPQDVEIGVRPSEDEVDEPLPRRPLRARPF